MPNWSAPVVAEPRDHDLGVTGWNGATALEPRTRVNCGSTCFPDGGNGGPATPSSPGAGGKRGHNNGCPGLPPGTAGSSGSGPATGSGTTGGQGATWGKGANPSCQGGQIFTGGGGGGGYFGGGGGGGCGVGGCGTGSGGSNYGAPDIIWRAWAHRCLARSALAAVPGRRRTGTGGSSWSPTGSTAMKPAARRAAGWSSSGGLLERTEDGGRTWERAQQLPAPPHWPSRRRPSSRPLAEWSRQASPRARASSMPPARAGPVAGRAVASRPQRTSAYPGWFGAPAFEVTSPVTWAISSDRQLYVTGTAGRDWARVPSPPTYGKGDPTWGFARQFSGHAGGLLVRWSPLIGGLWREQLGNSPGAEPL